MKKINAYITLLIVLVFCSCYVPVKDEVRKKEKKSRKEALEEAKKKVKKFYLHTGLSLFRKGDYKKALRLFKKLAELEPDNKLVLSLINRCEEKLKFKSIEQKKLIQKKAKELALDRIKRERAVIPRNLRNKIVDSCLVEDYDVKEFFKALIDNYLKMNVVFGPDVSGKITIDLKNITLKNLFKVTLKMKNLAALKEDNIVYILTKEGMKRKLEGEPIEKVFDIRYAKIETIEPMIKSYLSTDKDGKVKGKIFKDVKSKILLVRDTPKVIEKIEKILKKIDVRPLQILVEAAILEIKTDDIYKIGFKIDWKDDDVRIIGGENREANFVTEGFASPPGSEGITALLATISNNHLTATIEAIRSLTDFKLIASPKILALDGEKATFHIGDKLGYKTRLIQDGNVIEQVEYLDVGTSLEITPNISKDGYIRIKIRPKVSEGSVSAETGIPSEKTTEAKTNILVKDGQTVIIGGLFRDRYEEIEYKVPLLGDIPLIGHLFRRTEKSKTKNEIIVLITTRIASSDMLKDFVKKDESAKKLKKNYKPWLEKSETSGQ